MKAARAAALILLIGLAFAPSAFGQADPLTGQWSWLNGTVTVKRSGSGWIGATDAQLRPVLGRSVAVSVVSGTVRIKVKGARRFRKLSPSEVVPTGSTLDTRRGRVRITAAADAAGGTQTADFFAGIFEVSQKRSGLVDLRLAGRLENCRRSKRSSASARKRKGRRLWGDGKGRFRTRGKRSSALVRGTRWLVYDQCDSSTYNAVSRGSVAVRDFRRKKTITLTAGGRSKYVAR